MAAEVEAKIRAKVLQGIEVVKTEEGDEEE